MQVELVLLVISILFFVSILADKVGFRFGVPALLLFLGVGMLFGSDGLGINFESTSMAQTIGTVALCIILFSGGMDTRYDEIRPVLWQGVVLATVGVFLTAAITGVAIWWILGMTSGGVAVGLTTALLLASTMSSTDSASVFSILRSKGLKLKNNLRPILELESGSNDPMAYVLTITLISLAGQSTSPNIGAVFSAIAVQLIVGAVFGYLFGKAIVFMVNKLEIENDALYPIFVLTTCIFLFSITHFCQGNSYLAVYIGGLVIGNARMVHKRSTMRFFEGLSWLSQLIMFLTLGLLVKPHELLPIAVPALIISFLMIFITRPLSVYLCLAPFRKMKFSEKTFVSWVGLRGAVPIIFAILTLAADVPNARLIFNIVFFCTLVSLVVQGTTLPKMARLLGVAMPPETLEKPRSFDIDLPEEIKSVATELNVSKEMLKNGNKLVHLGLPEKTLVIMVKRGNGFFVPTGKSVLKENDKLLIITDDDSSLKESIKSQEKN